mgnify:CR=1 FL=1
MVEKFDPIRNLHRFGERPCLLLNGAADPLVPTVSNANLVGALQAAALRGVEAAHTTSGRVDMILEVVADTTEALDDTLDRIGEAKGVRSSESLIHLSTKLDRR